MFRRRPDSPFDHLFVVISKQEVDAGNTSATLTVLQRLLESPEIARSYCERVEVSFDGYNQTPLEIFEMPEVRDFVYQLDDQFPYWLFFCSKHGRGLLALTLCYVPPFLRAEVRDRVFRERIGPLLENRWFPALNYICEYAGFSEEQIRRLTDRVARYFTSGPFIR